MLEQSKKINDIKSQHERQIYELTTENFQKLDKIQQKFESEKK
jgi:hypothetical protein